MTRFAVCATAQPIDRPLGARRWGAHELASGANRSAAGIDTVHQIERSDDCLRARPISLRFHRLNDGSRGYSAYRHFWLDI